MRKKRQQALEDKILALKGKPTSDQEKKLLEEMLEIRVTELQAEGFLRQEAINKSCKEIARDFETLEKEEVGKQSQILEEVKQRLESRTIEEALAPDEEASRKKKLEEEEEEEKKKEDEGKQKSSSSTFNAATLTSDGSAVQNKTPEDAVRSAPPGATVYMHVNTHSITYGWREGPPRDFGKSNGATTLDYEGLRLTGFDMGLHGEARLELIPNATKAQKQQFIDAATKAQQKIQQQALEGYSLLNNNCQKAKTTLANAVDPSMQICSMPWSADSEFKNKHDQQSKLKQQNAEREQNMLIDDVRQAKFHQWITSQKIEAIKSFFLTEEEKAKNAAHQNRLNEAWQAYQELAKIQPEENKSNTLTETMYTALLDKLVAVCLPEIEGNLKDFKESIGKHPKMPEAVKKAFSDAGNNPAELTRSLLIHARTGTDISFGGPGLPELKPGAALGAKKLLQDNQISKDNANQYMILKAGVNLTHIYNAAQKQNPSKNKSEPAKEAALTKEAAPTKEAELTNAEKILAKIQAKQQAKQDSITAESPPPPTATSTSVDDKAMADRKAQWRKIAESAAGVAQFVADIKKATGDLDTSNAPGRTVKAAAEIANSLSLENIKEIFNDFAKKCMETINSALSKIENCFIGKADGKQVDLLGNTVSKNTPPPSSEPKPPGPSPHITK